MNNTTKNIDKNTLNLAPYTSYNEYLEDLLQYYRCLITGKHNTSLDITNINQRLNSSKQKSSYPLIYLQEKLQLSDFQIYCIIIGLLHHNQPNLFKILGEIGEKVLIPDIEYIYNLYPNKRKLNFLKIHKEINEDFINTYFENQSNHKENRWKTLVTLNKDCVDFLLNKDIFLIKNEKKQAIYNSNFKLFPLIIDSDFSNSNAVSSEISRIYQACNSETIIHLYGKEFSGRLYNIRQAMAKIEKSVLLFSPQKLKYIKDFEQDEQLFIALRMAKFHNAVPVICNFEELCGNAYPPFLQLAYKIFHFFNKHFNKMFCISDQLNFETQDLPRNLKFTHYEIKTPNSVEQFVIWKKSLATLNNTSKNIDINAIVNRYDFPQGQIKAAITKAQLHALKYGKEQVDQEALNHGCRQSCSTLQASGTHIVDCKYGWDDIILSSWQKMSLQHACNYIALKHVVYEDWGFQKSHQYGNNLSILMEGPPGTGKTMAAQVLAKELNMPLYKVDIAETVSKYIGETEKKLKIIFDEAEKSNAILFIDEMESFFSKRTQVKDSHDKYANMETSFLLQKMESFKGILLLATNHLEMIDEAFIRRIKFIINFGMPDEKQRLKLWQNMFIPTAPLGNTVDLTFLAKQLEISGGTIKNIVLKSAFLAVAENSDIEMRHILNAAKSELKKQGKILLNSDFGDYAFLLDN